MTTDYYLHINNCVTCGKPEKIIQIGVQFSGRCFSLYTYENMNLISLYNWIDLMLFDSNTIFNEYREKLTINQMVKIITKPEIQSRDWSIPPCMYQSWEKYHEINGTERGPSGLLRNKIGKNNCVGHGPGYDYILK